MSGAGPKAKLEFSCSRGMERKAAYVLSFFMEVIGLPLAGEEEDVRRCVTVHYGERPEGDVPAGCLFIRESPEASPFFSSPDPLDASAARRVELGSFTDVPVLFPCDESAEGGKPGFIPHDIVASAFYFLSNREEVDDERRDSHGRFPYSRSAAARLGLDGRPVVDRYIGVLREMLVELCRGSDTEFKPAPPWPDGKEFALCLTHDVDCVRRYSLCSLRQKFPSFNSLCSGSSALWKTLYAAQGLLNPVIDRIDPFWAFRDIVSIEESFGFSSSFYFQAGGSSPFDTVCYRLSDGDVEAVIAAVREAGFEVGLHGSYESGFTEGLLEKEMERLSSLSGEVLGQRQHFLRIDPRRSFGIYSRAGLRYDTTLGYADREGWRNGTTFPFNPYDAAGDAAYPVLEIPLAVMEWTLTHYRGLSPDEAWPVLKSFLETARGLGGCLCLLWHVHMFSSRPLRDLYVRALRWAAENNGWGVSAGRIYGWWTARRGGLI